MCTDGHLEYIVVETTKNKRKFLIEPTSVERRIKELRQAVFVTDDSRDVSRHDATTTDDLVATRRDMSRHDEDMRAHETPEQHTSLDAFERERTLMGHILEGKDRLLAEKDQRIASLEKDKTELQQDKATLRDQLSEQRSLHQQQVQLLLENAKESTRASSKFLNFMHSIWPSGKNDPSRELPNAYTPIIDDVPETLSDEEQPRP